MMRRERAIGDLRMIAEGFVLPIEFRHYGNREPYYWELPDKGRDIRITIPVGCSLQVSQDYDTQANGGTRPVFVRAGDVPVVVFLTVVRPGNAHMFAVVDMEIYDADAVVVE